MPVKGKKVDKDKTKSPPLEKSSVEVVGDGKIMIEKGVTKNMGDYNSARCTVGITLSFNETNFEATKKIANKLVDEELKKQVDDLMDEF